MSWTSPYRDPTRRELQTFGLVLAAGFSLIGLIPVVFRNGSPGRHWLALGLAAAAMGFLTPNLLRGFHRVWMAIGSILGSINTRILLTVVFYLAVTPVRLLMTVVGKDPMNRKFNPKADTYRIPRKARECGHMRHQF